jgi:hypothetical protein
LPRTAAISASAAASRDGPSKKISVAARAGQFARARRRAAARGGERAEAHRIVARHRDVGERSRQTQREAELVVVAWQAHRGAGVDQDGDFDLALGSKGADRQIVEPGKRVPVEEAQVVALGVLLETFGFDAESLHAPQLAAAFAHGA